MVGREDIPVIRTSTYDENYGTSTYSVRKEKKRTNVQTTDVNVENGTACENDDYRTLVDNFVHEVIERAKQEYLSGCANGGIDTRLCEERGDRLHTDADTSSENEQTKKHEKGPGNKRSGSGKGGSGRRKPHYKYSGPVDEKEISGYESPEASSLLNKRPQFELEDPGQAEHRSTYQRVAASLRRLLSCCAGKTWSP